LHFEALKSFSGNRGIASGSKEYLGSIPGPLLLTQSRLPPKCMPTRKRNGAIQRLRECNKNFDLKRACQITRTSE